MVQLKEIEPQLIEMGYRLFAISPDKPKELRKIIKKRELTYTLLSDGKMEASRAFGIAFEVQKNTAKNRLLRGIIKKASGESHHLLPVPSVFIVGTDGVIDFVHSNPNYKVRIPPQKLLEAAKAALE